MLRAGHLHAQTVPSPVTAPRYSVSTHDRPLFTDKRQDEEPWLLRVEEVARLLGLSRSKVYEMIADGTLSSVTIGRSRRIRREDLRRFVVDRTAVQR